MNDEKKYLDFELFEGKWIIKGNFKVDNGRVSPRIAYWRDDERAVEWIRHESRHLAREFPTKDKAMEFAKEYAKRLEQAI